MEEGRTANPAQPDRPGSPGENDASGLSHETLILPKGSGVAESAAPGQREALAAQAEESKWGARFQLGLVVCGLTWGYWAVSLLIGSQIAPNPNYVLGFFVITSLILSPACAKRFRNREKRTPFDVIQFYCAALNLAVSGIWLLATLMASKSKGREVFLVEFISVLGLAAVFAALRIGHRIFAQLQTRLAEWLVLVFAMGLVMATLMPLVQLAFPNSYERDRQIAASVLAMLVTSALLVAGATWAWSAAKQLGVEDGKHRIVLMLKGWFMIVGFGAFATFVITLLVLIMEGTRWLSDSPVYPAFFFGSLFLIPAMIPGLMVHRRAKRAAAAKAPTEGLP